MTLAKNRPVNLDERIMDAARKLAQDKPLNHIGLSEIARLSGVSWPTVKRHVGSKEALRSRLISEQPDLLRSVRDTRGRLLDAAARVFATRGYERATLDEVASVAGLTKGAVYWHFESKGDLFRALLQEYLKREAEFRERRAERVSGSTSLSEAMKALVMVHAERLAEAPEWARLSSQFVAEGHDDGVRSELAAERRRNRAAIAELLSELERDGKARLSANVEEVAVMVAALLCGIGELSLLEPDVDLAAMCDTLVRVFVDGASLLNGAGRPHTTH